MAGNKAAAARTRLVSVHGMQQDKLASVHHIPFSIQHDGPAPVERFFCVEERGTSGSEEDSVRELHASFRGRSLRGHRLHLPEQYQGVVLDTQAKARSVKQSEPDDLDADAEGLQEAVQDAAVLARFESFVYWNHDAEPRPDDTMQRLTEWCKLARVMHES